MCYDLLTLFVFHAHLCLSSLYRQWLQIVRNLILPWAIMVNRKSGSKPGMQEMDLVHVEILISRGIRSSLNTSFMSGESTRHGISQRPVPFMDLCLCFAWLGVIPLSSTPTVFFPKSMLSYSFTLLTIPFPTLTNEKHLSPLACFPRAALLLVPRPLEYQAKGPIENIRKEVYKGCMTTEQLTRTLAS